MKVIILPFFLVAFLLLVPVALATAPVPANGTISPVTDLGTLIMVADGYLVFHHSDVHTLTGALVGSTTEDAILMVDPSTGRGTFSGKLFFTGTADGVSGSLVISLKGVISLPGVTGNWAIIGGEGGLANLYGEGTWDFTNIFAEGTYSGRIHFDGP